MDTSLDFQYVFSGGKDGKIFKTNIIDGTIELIHANVSPIIYLKYDQANG